MAHMLESAGSGLDRIVKMTVVLADSADYDEMNRVWREFFPVDPPARTTCALQLSNGNGVEIECIALAGERPSWAGLGSLRESSGMDLKLAGKRPGSRMVQNPNAVFRTLRILPQRGQSGRATPPAATRPYRTAARFYGMVRRTEQT
jgi:hypothetical protein